MQNSYALLASGVTLGVYIPALVLHKQFLQLGETSEFFVLEELFQNSKIEKLSKTKSAFQQNFKFAKMAQKIPEGINNSICNDSKEKVINHWLKIKQKKFLIFSGYWLDIVNEYIDRSNFDDIKAFLCRMDSTCSASWNKLKLNRNEFVDIWMFSIEKNDINSFIDIDFKPVVPFNKRVDQILIHGGGWGIGTFREAISEINNDELRLNIILYNNDDISLIDSENNYYMLDPEWVAWNNDQDTDHTFPSIGKINPKNNRIAYKTNQTFSEVFNLIKKNKAIISKPGGATLIDSLASATPLIFLEPFGDYEAKNALLWQQNGFGISFSDWMRSRFSLDILSNLHHNILSKRKKLSNYINNFYATGIKEEMGS